MLRLMFAVTEADTAIALGSGDVPVLATPRLVAWFEAASVAACAPRLDASSTSVGIEVWIRHVRPSAVGTVVEVSVTEVSELDRGLAFDVVAAQTEPGPEGPVTREVATGRILRAVVDREVFLARVGPAQAGSA